MNFSREHGRPKDKLLLRHVQEEVLDVGIAQAPMHVPRGAEREPHGARRGVPGAPQRNKHGLDRLVEDKRVSLRPARPPRPAGWQGTPELPDQAPFERLDSIDKRFQLRSRTDPPNDLKAKKNIEFTYLERK